MNKKVRRCLIDMARKMSVITHQKLSDECNLNLDITDEIDRVDILVIWVLRQI